MARIRVSQQNQPVTIQKLVVQDKGDMSVGIFPSRWEISGELIFDTHKDYIIFRAEILTVFRLIIDSPYMIAYDKVGDEVEISDWDGDGCVYKNILDE